MSDQWATVAEARKLTGKSESTIKRLVREIVADARHPDRDAIQSRYGEMVRMRDNGEPYVWRIDTRLQLRRYDVRSHEVGVSLCLPY